MLDKEEHANDAEFKSLMSPHQVQGVAVDGVYYIPEYISKDQEQELLDGIYREKWTVLSNRRLQNHGGIPNAKGMFVSALPKWLMNPIGDELFEKYRIWSKKPNHVLVNEYLESQGIDAHKDGPVYEPYVAILSLESTVLIEFAPDPYDLCFVDESGEPKGDVVDNRAPFSLILEPRSLLVFTGDAYHHYLHRIDHATKLKVSSEKHVANLDMLGPESHIVLDESVIERSRRISLTYRVVKKTLSRSLIRL